MTYCRADITEKQRKRLLDAEARGSDWLARGNFYRESAGAAMTEKARDRLNAQAQRCDVKSQHWLDVANELRGMGE
jgi:hypothetical protein